MHGEDGGERDAGDEVLRAVHDLRAGAPELASAGVPLPRGGSELPAIGDDELRQEAPPRQPLHELRGGGGCGNDEAEVITASECRDELGRVAPDPARVTDHVRDDADAQRSRFGFPTCSHVGRHHLA